MKANWRTIVFILGMFLAVVVLMDFSRRLEERDRLEIELTKVRAEATEVMGTQVNLVTQQAYITSEGAVEQWAYEDGKWVRDGETLVQIIPAGTPVPTPGSDLTEEDETPPNWRLWWNLFFDSQP